MPRTCTVCLHPKRSEVDAALLAGEPLRTIADQFGPSKTALLRHREHVAPALAVAKQAAAVADADSLLEKVRGLEVDARRIGKAAETAGDARIALGAVRELTRIIELLGRLRGELDSKGSIKMTVGAESTGPFVVELTTAGHADLLCPACRERVLAACTADLPPPPPGGMRVFLPPLLDDA